MLHCWLWVKVSTYADDAIVFLLRCAYTKVAKQTLAKHEKILGNKINLEKWDEQQLRDWRGGLPFPGPFRRSDGHVLGVWLGLDIQLNCKWSEVQTKLEVPMRTLTRKRFSLKGRVEVYICPLFFIGCEYFPSLRLGYWHWVGDGPHQPQAVRAARRNIHRRKHWSSDDWYETKCASNDPSRGSNGDLKDVAEEIVWKSKLTMWYFKHHFKAKIRWNRIYLGSITLGESSKTGRTKVGICVPSPVQIFHWIPTLGKLVSFFYS